MTDAKKAAGRTAIVYDDVYKAHRTGPGHPESPARCDAILGGLAKAGLDGRLSRLRPRRATDAELTACHGAAYVALARKEIAAGRPVLSTGDTIVCRDSLEPALQAAGGACAAVDAVVGGKAPNAFCVVRPPGHHATPDKGMGFCVFNNIAVAARYAQRKHRIGKVLVADWDVHHGNGTQDIFYADPSVFFFSTHQFPWYPGTGRAKETGAGKGKGTTLNCPFAAGAGGKEIVGAFRERLLPAARRFRPELVLLSAGFDSRKGDPLGGFRLEDADFAALTRLLLDLARESAGGRLVAVLEGGYALDGIAAGAAAMVRELSRGE
jgi:acetoin utilization deacetylase AcuC-like enzyme